MSNLENKLKEILLGVAYNEAVDAVVIKDEIAQIKQAFADEKWLEPNTDRYNLQQAFSEAVKNQPPFEIPFMTGQEWYAKFKKEWDDLLPDVYIRMNPQDIPTYFRDVAGKAAKKASGINDD